MGRSGKRGRQGERHGVTSIETAHGIPPVLVDYI
jgi:hypothetical protein